MHGKTHKDVSSPHYSKWQKKKSLGKYRIFFFFENREFSNMRVMISSMNFPCSAVIRTVVVKKYPVTYGKMFLIHCLLGENDSMTYV